MDQAVEQHQFVQTDPPAVQEAWKMVTNQLQMEMKQVKYATWVQPLRAMDFRDGVFHLMAVNANGRDWVKDHLGKNIERLLEGIYGRQVSLNLHLDSSAAGSQEEAPGTPAPPPETAQKAGSNGRKQTQSAGVGELAGSKRKISLHRYYGDERAAIVQPDRFLLITKYFFLRWIPLLGHSAAATIEAARLMCYWNVETGEMRNVVETDMSTLAQYASVSLRTVKDVLNNELVRKYFLRYKVRRVVTQYGVRTAGIILQVRMDEPLTPEDQEAKNQPELERWFSADFAEDEVEID